MLKSILLRMLVFTLAFGVGVGSEAIFDGVLKAPPSCQQQRVKLPLRLEFSHFGGTVGSPRIGYSICNDTPHSIWFYKNTDSQEYSVQNLVKGHWTDIPLRWCCPESTELIEVKPGSRSAFEIYPFLSQGTHRIGIRVFLSNPSPQIKGGICRVPTMEEGMIIWSAPFTLQW